MREIIVDLQIACREVNNIPNILNFKNWIEKILIYFHKKSEITIRLVDEEESRNLNLRYRGKNKSTNILSFPFEQPTNIKLSLLGDLVICFPLIEREAIEQGKNIELHLVHMLVHGVLHLLGYTHNTENETNLMECLEIKIMSILDYPNPYK
ncbi:rRNA maturation RNase YbeY [Candidatus Pantoea edessiphila]|uniref:Endoribonuclease YbeY n=1 Tax=Candidatus Pantoea edessiphila TaxID=2044610 RepID=A0A2P5T2E4_9GAMM|nr:rRNA maturation RNase YbeY [Candidatus Pantoea edessiphila]PPI88720.1 rRNA maturation RNase YbeY [Candidatus Pantoea edessiphila]